MTIQIHRFTLVTGDNGKETRGMWFWFSNNGIRSKLTDSLPNYICMKTQI